MEQQVAIFNSHKDAVEALKKLKEQDFPMDDVSLIGKAGMDKDHVHLDETDKVTNIPAYIGIGAGTVLGLLTGIGLFAIPGLGVLYGAGALVGAFAGAETGIIGGGLVSGLAKYLTKDDHIENIKNHIEAGKFVLVVAGDADEIQKAKNILHTENLHIEFYE
ncbi:hypothetical protein GR160_03785 [Flavobacterium sp. Sd200]|uniref:DUF1269 domain-containing protein n=1 Tax=Flavobacterium sp. Sd200 TaxID=2692211 RepID=UPI00136F96E9|nr:DUF1269 domain-containing protein [Flavobacterium sp. Sd200]MXN90336.1 hypothetical protein [Flavobacterium sp. Sd200]